ncbi:rhodanese-like domain-containing protein [Paenibacillus polymyxa]|uniref:rhodanese-like domain-containing protein n=1 Tax=Paenibacillus polymyxa TaxID=1406 RepID=UPI001BEA6F3A|nr:rhodanese-like domain-containing protein [Paenibacillus polymyxa]MBT2282462.1 rhodanese-like domain-containing protein [Paenibacillus polymyxa]
MSFKEIAPQEVAERLNKGETLTMLDVREPEEWMEGHVAGANHIPLGELDVRHEELDPSQEIIVICRSGNRSGKACELLNEKGFKVLNMTGGLNAWTDKLVRNYTRVE